MHLTEIVCTGLFSWTSPYLLPASIKFWSSKNKGQTGTMIILSFWQMKKMWKKSTKPFNIQSPSTQWSWKHWDTSHPRSRVSRRMLHQCTAPLCDPGLRKWADTPATSDHGIPHFHKWLSQLFFPAIRIDPWTWTALTLLLTFQTEKWAYESIQAYPRIQPTKHHSSPTQLHTSLLHRQRQLVTHNIGVPIKQATWGHQGSTHHTLFQGGRAGQNDQPAAAGQCASCKLQTTKPKACSNQLKAAADKHDAHTQHTQYKWQATNSKHVWSCWQGVIVPCRPRPTWGPITPPPPNYTHHYYTGKGSWWLTTLVSPSNRPHGATRFSTHQSNSRHQSAHPLHPPSAWARNQSLPEQSKSRHLGSYLFSACNWDQKTASAAKPRDKASAHSFLTPATCDTRSVTWCCRHNNAAACSTLASGCFKDKPLLAAQTTPKLSHPCRKEHHPTRPTPSGEDRRHSSSTSCAKASNADIKLCKSCASSVKPLWQILLPQWNGKPLDVCRMQWEAIRQPPSSQPSALPACVGISCSHSVRTRPINQWDLHLFLQQQKLSEKSGCGTLFLCDWNVGSVRLSKLDPGLVPLDRKRQRILGPTNSAPVHCEQAPSHLHIRTLAWAFHNAMRI